MTIDAKELMNSVEELKKAQDQAKKDSDALITGKIKELSESIAKGAEAAQKAQAKADAQEEQMKKLEEAMARPENKGADKGALNEHKEAFEAFFKGQKQFGSKNEAIIIPKSMSTDVNPDGGYLVRPELVNDIVGRAFETSPMRQARS